MTKTTVKKILISVFMLSLCPAFLWCTETTWLLPLNLDDRYGWHDVRLTAIGSFGAPRKARPGIEAHFHTAVDLARPRPNYSDEPVFPMGPGKVISLRDDGPFAQIIIAHTLATGAPIWSVYEHVAAITVVLGESVDPFVPIARFMNREELERYGWQFDHLHFEILKRAPRPLAPAAETPFRRFGSYSLECYTAETLEATYHNPQSFFESSLAAP